MANTTKTVGLDGLRLREDREYSADELEARGFSVFAVLARCRPNPEQKPARDGHVYFVQRPDGMIKIGFSTRVRDRIDELTGHSGVRLRLLATVPGTMKDEHAMHVRFAHLRQHRTEMFRPGNDLLRFIGALPKGA